VLQLGAAVVKAIRDSPLSLNPTNEGNEVLVKLPRLTTDTIGAATMYITCTAYVASCNLNVCALA
jgi:hypothetical protein